MMNRAYSVLEIRAAEDDGDERVITGIATSPTPDRMGDIVEPMGVTFRNPLPLLWQHRADQPVGTVIFEKPTEKGIQFTARLPKVLEPGRLKSRVDEAWDSVKSGLVRAVSIGFRALESSVMESGGYRFLESEVLELSLVTIPANADATIQTIKSIDADLRAASGRGSSGSNETAVAVQKKPVKLGQEARKMTKTLADQIADLEAERARKAERMEEILQKAANEGRSTDIEEQEEFDDLDAELSTLDADLKRYKALERAKASTAKPVEGVRSIETGTQARSITGLRIKKPVAPGTAFTRYAMALAAARGSTSDAISYVEARQKWMDETPNVVDFIRASAGTTTGEAWAAPLADETNLVDEFIELLRPATIIGRLPGIRQVPFNVRIPVQTGGSTVNWVGEAAPKPVSELAFDAISLGMDKVAGIVVLTDELVRTSRPNAEEVVRRDLVAQISRFLDQQFIDPSVAGGANNPASITNGVTPVAASGTDAEALYYDLNKALAAFDDSDMGVDTISLVMRPGTARQISSLRNALGQFEFNGLTMAGGVLGGFNAITSNSVPAGTIVLIKGDEVLMADDGGVSLDASREATLDMNGGDTPNFNLFQRNAVAIRAERFITWRKRRADAVTLISGAAYGPEAPEQPEDNG